MRIISGLFKGKYLNFLKNSNTRPLKDVVKESIFNILKHSNLIDVNIENSKVIDLYSGIGSFGIECISRGAKKVVFVEQDVNAAKILKENLDQFDAQEKTIIVNDKIENFFENQDSLNFNIFFLDPPFKDKKFLKILEQIKIKQNVKGKHIVIIHRENNSKDNLENYVNVVLTKNYGRSKITFGKFS